MGYEVKGYGEIILAVLGMWQDPEEPYKLLEQHRAKSQQQKEQPDGY